VAPGELLETRAVLGLAGGDCLILDCRHAAPPGRFRHFVDVRTPICTT
jgi:hypothetical protein